MTTENKTRTYAVEGPKGLRLIDAKTPAQAIRFATRGEYKAKVPTQKELIEILTGPNPPKVESFVDDGADDSAE